jgi:NADH dehydrogenase (ubiquinone) Fe-S protein 1
MLAFVNKNTSKILCKVDGKSLQASFGESLLQACFKAYIDIPRFCYHEGLQIAGNCRMCLVEVENSRKLVASCATPVVTKLSVYTKTFRVKKARQAVLEFLLINHPLDCPICDQGGECDLQDITLVFGSDRGRFYEMSKRAVVDKNLGPLIKTIMNRCIHCTRCVRFFKEVSLESDFSLLGLLGRGSSTEIGTYVLDDLLHELSGNVIDLCPVGALTSKPFAFKARTWELTSQYNFDVVDVMMPRVKMDLSGSQVLRILPYMEEYGYGWVSNKTRFFFDALNLKRLDQCL